MYTWEANLDDANEIGFSKHEILKVSSYVVGAWWQWQQSSRVAVDDNSPIRKRVTLG